MAATVIWHSSLLTGAPTLTNAWGSLVALLDACLVNGYGVKTVATLTSTSAGVATATVTAGHAFVMGQVVQIAGCAQSNYNGNWTVTSVTATTFSYQMDVPGTVRTATTTTSITAKTPGLGWTKPYSTTNKAAYKGVGGTGNMLLVDNALRSGYTTTWAKWAAVGIVSAMSSISTITGIQAPYDPSRPTRNWSEAPVGDDWGWAKWIHGRVGGRLQDGDGGAGNREWRLVGNGTLFYLWVKQSLSWGGYVMYAFGDVNSYVSAGDATGTILIATEASYEASSGDGTGGGVAVSQGYQGKWMLRPWTQLGLPVRVCGVPTLHLLDNQLGSGRGPMPYPHGPDNGLWLTPTQLMEEGASLIRGEMPGLYWMPQYKPVGSGVIIDQVIDGTARQLMTQSFGGYTGEDAGFLMAVDITGPW